MPRRRLIAVLLLLLAVAAALYAAARFRLLPAAYNPLAPLDLSEPPNPVTGVKLWLMARDTPACIQALAKAGVAVMPMPVRADKPACTRRGTVLISHLWRAQLKPLEMRCTIAIRLYLLERFAIQPLAQQHFGSFVTRIDDFGSYSCRTIRGRSTMSEHATANAYDLAGFRLASGRKLSVKNDWRAGGDAAGFIPAVRDAACRQFNMVLSPDYNADHRDHLHMDMGWLLGCH